MSTAARAASARAIILLGKSTPSSSVSVRHRGARRNRSAAWRLLYGDARQCRDSSLVTFSEDLPPHQEPSLRSRHYQRRPLACSQGAKHSPGYDRLRIARRAQCRAAMTPDVFFGTAYVISTRLWRAHLFVDLP